MRFTDNVLIDVFIWGLSISVYSAIMMLLGFLLFGKLVYGRKRPELDKHSRDVVLMYLHRQALKIEEELRGEEETVTAVHDLNCIDKTIGYLKEE